jgi:hypothetical protein
LSRFGSISTISLLETTLAQVTEFMEVLDFYGEVIDAAIEVRGIMGPE